MNQFRFTLSHDSGSQVISEPIGWADISLVLERSPEYWSLIEHFETSLQFYGENGEKDGGKDFILAVEQIGIDEIITILIEISVDEGNTYEEVFTGIIDLSTLNEVDDRRIECAIIRNDFWSKFKNREETPVDLQSTTDLDDNVVTPAQEITINLTSQIINQETEYEGHSGDFTTMAKVTLATDVDTVLSGLQTIQGIDLIAGRRVLVAANTDATENGPYVVSSGAWTRTTDANTDAEMEGAIINVTSGTYADTNWKQTATPVTLGVTNLVWVQYNFVDDYLLYEDDGTEGICDVDQFDFYISATTDITRKEIDFSTTIPVFAVLDPEELGPQIEIIEGLGQMTIAGTIDFSYRTDSSYSGVALITSRDDLFEWYYQINEETPVLITSYSINRPTPFSEPNTFNLTGSVSFDVNTSDRVRTYIRVNLDFNWDSCSGNWVSREFYGGITSQTVTFSFESQFEDTQAPGFFLHDAFAAVVERITGQPDSFYSEYLGSPNTVARQYEEHGCGSNYVLHKGLHLRGYTLDEKKVFQSFKTLWKGADPIFNLTVFEDTIDGNPVIRIEEKGYVFNGTQSTLLDWVNGIERKYDKEQIAKKIIIGYQKWESEDIRGIDDPQTKKTYATRLQTVGTEKTVSSEFIAASLAIESTRRKNAEKTTDHKFDNDTFIIAVNPTPENDSPVTYNPELDENFDSVTNITNSDTKYNLFLTPFRNFMRWANVFTGCLQSYPASFFKFSSGEGNYNLETEYDCTSGIKKDCQDTICGNISEDDDLEVEAITDQVGYLITPEIFEFEHPLDWEEYKSIRDNKRNAIGVSETGNSHDSTFGKKITYDINLSKAKFVVWKR
jgi:hypothetical protein